MSDTLKAIRAADADVPLIQAEDPFALFGEWFQAAQESDPPYPNAMTVATVDSEGMPDARIVLLKGFDDQGFTFFTNTLSAKGRQLGAAPRAALCFYWGKAQRQVRVRGLVAPVTTEEADAYFASRPRGSQIGAWASKQSEALEDREVFLGRIGDAEARYDGGDVPRPSHWSGYRVTPLAIEFWQERPFRLHDRLIFTRGEASAPWIISRAYP